eukprot:scaffold34205_cov26-Attheya_sp.AAC.1
MGQEGYGMAYNAIEDNEDSSLAESIVKYAERATMAERSIADLEGRLTVREMGTTMAPPTQAAYFLPQQPTFTFPPQPPPTQIHVPQQQGWAPAAGGKRRTEGNAYRGKKPRQSGRGGRGGNGYNNDTNIMRTQQAYSNKQKMNLNLFYCYSCGYDMDHDGYNCPVNQQTQKHLPHITRDNAHLVE